MRDARKERIRTTLTWIVAVILVAATIALMAIGLTDDPSSHECALANQARARECREAANPEEQEEIEASAESRP